MEFRICKNNHTVNIHPWTSFFTVIKTTGVDPITGKCIKCHYEGK